MMSLLIFIFTLGLLIVIHEFGHFITAKASGIKVDVFSIGFGPVLYRKKFQSFDFLICAVLWGGYVKLAGFSPEETKGLKSDFLSKPLFIRGLVIAAGPLFNYILAMFLFILVFLIGFPVPSSRVGKLVDGYPAVASGIKEGDLILNIDGKDVKTWEDVSGIIHNTEEGSLILTVLRAGEKKQFVLHPKREEKTDIFKKKHTLSFIGIRPSDEVVKLKYPFFEAVGKGVSSLFGFTWMTLKALGYVIIGALPLRDTFTGPLGIYYVTKQASHIGVAAVIHLMALLSMSLAVFNLLPLPVLDGGHIFFLMIEKIRGEPLSSRTEEIISRIGITFLIILVTLVMYNDVMRFGQGLFKK